MMAFFARHPNLRRSVALPLAAVLVSGCVTWRPVMESPGIALARQPAQVRVVFDTGHRMVLYAPSVAGEELIGYRRQGDEGSRVAIPMRSVRYVEVQEADIAVMSRGGGGFGPGRL
jgi:hypothetical protein